MNEIAQAKNQVDKEIQSIDQDYGGLRHSEYGLLGRVGEKGGYIGDGRGSDTETEYATNVIEALATGDSEFSSDLKAALVANGTLSDGQITIDEIREATGALQTTLKNRGQDLGTYGDNNNGIDYKWGRTTTAALQKEIGKSVAEVLPIHTYAMRETGAAAFLAAVKESVSTLDTSTNLNEKALGEAQMKHLTNVNKQLSDNGLRSINLRDENGQTLALKSMPTSDLAAFSNELAQLSEAIDPADFKKGGQQLKNAIDQRIDILALRADRENSGIGDDYLASVTTYFDQNIQAEIQAADIAEKYALASNSREDTSQSQAAGVVTGNGNTKYASHPEPTPTADPRHVHVTNEPKHNFTNRGGTQQAVLGRQVNYEFNSVSDVHAALLEKIDTNRSAEDLFANHTKRVGATLKALQQAQRDGSYTSRDGTTRSYPEFKEAVLERMAGLIAKDELNADAYHSQAEENRAATEAITTDTERTIAKGDNTYHTEAEKAAEFEGKGESWKRKLRTVAGVAGEVVNVNDTVNEGIRRHHESRANRRYEQNRNK